MLARERINYLVDDGFALAKSSAFLISNLFFLNFSTPFLEFSSLAGYELYGKV
jgi:hypothetical protein